MKPEKMEAENGANKTASRNRKAGQQSGYPACSKV